MAETRIYRCVTPCTWLKRYWAVGSIYKGTGTPPPEYFVLTADDAEPEPTPSTPGGDGCKCPDVATDSEYDEMLADVGLLPATGAA